MRCKMCKVLKAECAEACTELEKARMQLDKVLATLRIVRVELSDPVASKDLRRLRDMLDKALAGK